MESFGICWEGGVGRGIEREVFGMCWEGGGGRRMVDGGGGKGCEMRRALL